MLAHWSVVLLGCIVAPFLALSVAGVLIVALGPFLTDY
jgi:hypothetical protein